METVKVVNDLIPWGTSISDIQHFLAIFDLPTFSTLFYNVCTFRAMLDPLPTLKLDVIYGRSFVVISAVHIGPA